jgi:putative inorganic carbon (HCO3(-)) transporter
MNRLENYPSPIITEEERQRIYGLEFKFINHQFFREGAAFFFLCFYYFMEYARLQGIYPWLDVLPWGMLAAIFSVLFMTSDKYRQHPNNLLVFAVYTFIFLIFMSMTYAVDSKAASIRGYAYLNWLIVFFSTISLVTTERRFVIFLLLYFLWNFKMSQHGAYSWMLRGFSFAGWGVSGPKGYFENSGEYGLQMAMICVLSLCYFFGTQAYLKGWRKWLVFSLPLTSFMTVLASSSRGDYLGLIAGLLWLALAAKGKRLRYGVLFICILSIGYWAMPVKMLERFDVAGKQSDQTSYTRETRWKAAYETFREHPIFGIGLGSWLLYYSRHYPREEGYEGWGVVHNSFLEVMAELGSAGLVFMILIFVGMFSLNKRTRDMASRYNDQVAIWLSSGFDAGAIAYLVGGSFMSVFHYPYVWVHSAMIICLYVVTKRNLMSSTDQGIKNPYKI